MFQNDEQHSTMFDYVRKKLVYIGGHAVVRAPTESN